MNLLSLPLAGAALAMLWAALLALAEGALAGDPAVGRAALPRIYAEKPERLRRGLAIGRITLLSLAALALSGAVRWWARPFLPAAGSFVVLVLVVLVAADLGPRLLGLRRARTVGNLAVKLTAASMSLLAPVVIAVGIIDRGFARMFGVQEPRGQTRDLAQREMLLGVFALADTTVSEIMTPRTEIVGIEGSASFDDAVKRTAAVEFARLPVYDGDLDHIVGVLYAKDLLKGRFGLGPATEWRSLIRPAEIVPEVKTLDRQLRDFQRGVGHLAVVVDEFGGTAGIITLEDVLEEIVGEIGDEYDVPEGDPVVELMPNVWSVDGRAPLDVLASAIGVSLEHEEVTTAGGFVVAALGHLPQSAETLDVAGFRVTVERMEKRRVARLRFERLPEPEPADDDEVVA